MRFFVCLFLLLLGCKVAWNMYWRVRRVIAEIRELNVSGLLVAGVDLQRVETEKAHARRAEMSFEGATWTEWEPAEVSDSLTGSHLLNLRRCGIGTRFYGPMKFELDGDTLSIFDVQCMLNTGRNLYEPMFQTVITNSPRELDVPHFYIRPYMKPVPGLHLGAGTPYAADARLSCYTHVDSANLLEINYVGESLLPTRAKAFFQTAFASEHLLPFIQERQWTAEWTDDRLAVYSLRKLVPPTELQYFAADVRHLAELIHQTSAAYVADLDRRIEQAASHLAERT